MLSSRFILLISVCLMSIIIIGVNPILSTPTEIKNNQIHAIFDLNGVLTQTSGAAQILGIKKFIAYLLLYHKNPLRLKSIIKEKLYDFLNTIKPRDPFEIAACDEQGNLLPQLMCDWLKGTTNSSQLIEKVALEAAKKPKNLEQNILASISYMLFTPEKFVKTQTFVPQALSFAKKLKRQSYKVYIFSNWDPESFEIMRKNYPHVFELFDGIIISGHINLIKPDPQFYITGLEKLAIDVEKAIFIDDQLVNVKAAQSIGLASIHCKTAGFINPAPDIASVEKKFGMWRNLLTYNKTVTAAQA